MYHNLVSGVAYRKRAHLRPFITQTQANDPELVKAIDDFRLVRLLTKVLLLTILIQEAKLSPKGLVFPVLRTASPGFSTGLPFVSEVVILTIIAAFTCITLVRKLRLITSWAQVYVSWLAWWIAISVCFAYLRDVPQGPSAFGATRMFLESMALLFIVSRTPWTRQDIVHLYWLLIGTAVFHSAVILASYLGVNNLNLTVYVLGNARYSGMFLQPSRLALLFAISLTAVMARLLVDQLPPTKALLHLLAAGTIAAGLMLTQTRMAIFAAGFCVIWIVATYRQRVWDRKGKAITLLAAFVTVGAAIASAGILDAGISRFQIPGDFGGTRQPVWSQSLDILLRYPLGTGFGGLKPLTGWIPHAHSLYLHWAVMFGLPGVALLIYFISRVYMESAKLKLHWDKSALAFYVALRASWVTYLVASMAEPFQITNVGYWFWLLAGLLAAPGLFCDQ